MNTIELLCLCSKTMATHIDNRCWACHSASDEEKMEFNTMKMEIYIMKNIITNTKSDLNPNSKPFYPRKK